MNDELTPPEEEQPQPSRTRFRDTARTLGSLPDRAGKAYESGIQKTREAFPNATKVSDSVLRRDHGLDKDKLGDALNNPSAKEGVKDLKNIAKELPSKSLAASKGNAKKSAVLSKSLVKNKKWFLGGAAGLGILIPIAAFFLWMMLFKNVHIKNLYVTYRWAQFNRGLNTTLKKQLKYVQDNPEVKPTGDVDTVVKPTDPIDVITQGTDKGFDPATIDPDADAAKLVSTEMGVEGNAADVITDRNIKPAIGDGATPEEQARSAKDAADANIEKSISEKGRIEGPDAKPIMEDGVKEVEQQIADGKPAPDAANSVADSVASGGNGWKGVLSKASTAVFVSTIYCIFRDLYTNGKDKLPKIAMNGSMGVSQELNKTADCQKMGDCDANQIGAMSERLDDGEKSWSDSCEGSEVQSINNPGCVPIDPKFIVNGLGLEIGKIGNISLDSADKLLDPPDFQVKFLGATVSVPFDSFVDRTCSAVMNPFVQGGITIAEGAAIIGTGGGWAALGKGVGAGIAQMAGTAGGKALIASYLTKMSGSLYKNLSPTDTGSLLGMGNAVAASATCAKSYCPQVDDETVSQLNREYRAERIAANSKRSVLEKFFDAESPDSVVARVAINTPTTPSAMMGKAKNMLASITNPIQLSKSLGATSIALTRGNTALAAEQNSGSRYGLSGRIAVPPSLLEDVSYEDIVNWGKNADFTKYSKYDKCATDSYQDLVIAGDNLCSWNGPMKDDGGRMYMQYKYTQNAAFKNALMRNNQSNLKGSVGGAVGASEGSGSTDGIDPNNNTVGTPCPTGTTSAGSGRTYGGSEIGLCDIGDGTIVNTSAAKIFYDMKQAAAADGIKLAGGGFRSYEEQVALRKAHCPDWQNSRANACRPPTAKPGTSRHEVGLAVDMDNSRTRGTAVFQWLNANASRFGIKNLESEPWHWSVDGS